MKKIAIRQLAAEVATLLGESLALECQPAESPFPDLEDKVRKLAPILLTELIKEEKWSHLLDGAVKITASPEIDSDGNFTVPLPDDFLRILYVKMSDWRRPVTEISSPDDPRQGSRWKGIRGNSDRPMVMLGVNSAGRSCLRLQASGKGASLSEAFYIALPEVGTDDTIAIPRLLYHNLIRSLIDYNRLPPC